MLGARSRNSAGLQALLTRFLSGIVVKIAENVPRWVPLPDRPPIGRGARIGQDVLIGRRVYDESGTFRIILGVLSLAQFQTLLPGGDNAALVNRLVRLYAPDLERYESWTAPKAKKL